MVARLSSSLTLLRQTTLRTPFFTPLHHHHLLLPPPFTNATATATATATLKPNFPIVPQRRNMYRGGYTNNSSRGCPSFSTLAQCSSSGRGQPEKEGSRQGSGGRGRGRGAPPGSVSDRIDTLSRLLTRILRHMATELSLDMRGDGYVRVQDLLQLNLKTRANIPLKSHSIDEIREAVRVDNKQRLGLLEENGQLFIRANQGHSVQVVETESLLEPITSAEEIPVCVHGTYKKFLESILQSGLLKMNRLHIHFASGLPSDKGVISGMRRDVNMLIHLDVKRALDDGMKLYRSENNVILTEGFDGAVPAKYFQKIELWPSRKPVPFQL